MCSILVSIFLTEIVQHIHSLRANFVIFSQTFNASLSEAKAFRKSIGILCTEPPEISLLIINNYYFVSTTTLNPPKAKRFISNGTGIFLYFQINFIAINL
jgi:hypothetical protein